MRLTVTLLTFASSIMLSACMQKGSNPIDPYEPFNRKIHNFNMAIDATMLKPPAKFYKAVVPAPIRVGINNAYNNVLMLPTVASDLLQGDWRYAIKDTWRFLINSTIGLAGFVDAAERGFSLPPHYNDLGITFAKWGNKNSPYIVIPLLGPSTVRDGMSLPFDYMFTPYPFLASSGALYALAAFRYVDLRAQLLESDAFLNEAIDKYAFIRDAYLQHRNFQISGEKDDNQATLYVDEGSVNDYIDDETPALNNKSPGITKSSNQHVANRTVPTRNSAEHR